MTESEDGIIRTLPQLSAEELDALEKADEAVADESVEIKPKKKSKKVCCATFLVFLLCMIIWTIMNYDLL